MGEIWEVVDRGGKGWLEREEFVMGMWLVDQGLMGRKCPWRVGEGGWEVVRGGGEVPVPPPRRRGG